MVDDQDHNYSEHNKSELDQEESERKPKEIDSCKKMLISDELKAMLFKEAEDFESYAIEAFNDGKNLISHLHLEQLENGLMSFIKYKKNYPLLICKISDLI
jgi:hypothetical protein